VSNDNSGTYKKRIDIKNDTKNDYKTVSVCQEHKSIINCRAVDIRE
jgi:hypothetical protein